VRYTDPSGHTIGLPPVNIDPCRLNPEIYQGILNDEYSQSSLENTTNYSERSLSTPTSVPLPQATITPLSPQQQMTLSAVFESQTYLSEQPASTVCPVPPEAERLDTGEALALLREWADDFDPFTPDAFTGTSTGWLPMLEYARNYVQTVDLANPTINPIDFIIDIGPTVAFTYNFIYDHATNTGPYSDIPVNLQTISYVTLFTSIFLLIP
jgi:hypothetical protein